MMVVLVMVVVLAATDQELLDLAECGGLLALAAQRGRRVAESREWFADQRHARLMIDGAADTKERRGRWQARDIGFVGGGWRRWEWRWRWCYALVERVGCEDRVVAGRHGRGVGRGRHLERQRQRRRRGGRRDHEIRECVHANDTRRVRMCVYVCARLNVYARRWLLLLR